MRNVHPAAWIGLLLNILFAYLLYSSLGAIDLAIFAEQDRATVESFLGALEALRPYHLGILALQALALGLMISGLPFGLGLAMFASILTMPGSIVYCIGSLLTHYRVKYAGFEQIVPDASDARIVFKSYAIKRMRLFTMICSTAFFIFAVLGKLDLAATFMFASLAGIVFISRAKKYPALIISSDHCTVTPGLFASGILLPYVQMHSALLNEDETIHFTMQTPQGTATLVWPLNIVEPKERRAAVEELGAALASHGVHLI